MNGRGEGGNVTSLSNALILVETHADNNACLPFCCNIQTREGVSRAGGVFKMDWMHWALTGGGGGSSLHSMPYKNSLLELLLCTTLLCIAIYCEYLNNSRHVT